jgi:uncharacterized protein GlcG (DUF336 family)
MALDLSTAQQLVRAAAERAVASYGKPVCVAVCDASGFLLAFARGDGAPVRSIAIAQGKAYTAARIGVDTDAFLARLQRDRLSAADFCDDRLSALPGGAAIKDGAGQLLGGLGISGLTSAQDQEIATALAAALAQPAAGPVD